VAAPVVRNSDSGVLYKVLGFVFLGLVTISFVVTLLSNIRILRFFTSPGSYPGQVEGPSWQLVLGNVSALLTIAVLVVSGIKSLIDSSRLKRQRTSGNWLVVIGISDFALALPVFVALVTSLFAQNAAPLIEGIGMNVGTYQTVMSVLGGIGGVLTLLAGILYVVAGFLAAKVRKANIALVVAGVALILGPILQIALGIITEPLGLAAYYVGIILVSLVPLAAKVLRGLALVGTPKSIARALGATT
jgi:hypothetical protein